MKIRWRIQTFTGLLWDSDAPEFRTLDIAVSLSRKARFSGHTSAAYTVAQHSHLCWSQAVKAGESIDVQRWCLLHDSVETYMGDIAGPLKVSLLTACQQLHFVEGALEGKLAAALGTPPGCYVQPSVAAAVRRYDLRALATERRDLMRADAGVNDSAWGVLPEPFRLGSGLRPWSESEARCNFLQAWREAGIPWLGPTYVPGVPL